MKSEQENKSLKIESPALQHNPRFLRKRKMLMLLPLLIFPFACLLFFAMKGTSHGKVGPNEKQVSGLNPELPDAHLKDQTNWSKLDFYEQADKDSVKWNEKIKNDPYYRLYGELKSEVKDSGHPSNGYQNNASGSGLAVEKDPNEEKVYRKLAALNAELDRSSHPSAASRPPVGDLEASSSPLPQINVPTPLMHPTSEPDTELIQVNRMLDKIMDIQHPDRVHAQIKAASEKNKTKVYQVGPSSTTAHVSEFGGSSIDSLPKAERTGFFSLSEDQESSEENSISAVVHERQTLVSGATVKLRLEQDVFIAGQLVLKNQFVYGLATLSGDRLQVQVNTIRFRSSVFPVSLQVYDLDGLPGIHIPGAITRQALKETTDQNLQSLGLASLNTSIGAQAASAGIETAKNLLSKKIRLVSVSLSAGYRVLLKDMQPSAGN